MIADLDLFDHTVFYVDSSGTNKHLICLKKYNLHLLNSGSLYRFAAYLLLKHKPKKTISFLKKRFKNLNYKLLSKKNLHTEEISNYSAVIAKQKKIRIILRVFQKKFANKFKRVAIEGRDISSKILTCPSITCANITAYALSDALEYPGSIQIYTG